MTLQSINCDRELLRLSLDERLEELQEERLARHLAECEACQRELERLAGEHAAWSKISVALQQESEIRSRRGRAETLHASDSKATNSTGFDDPADDLLADFAVDFLGPSSAADSIGRIGEIDILEVIGRGGMGVVLKGYQPELKRLVAVKVLAPHLAVSGPARQRFAREAQATAAILHPNVVPILTVHSTGKLPYLVMPFLACESLQQRISRQGALDLVDVLRIGLQTAQGLAAAHAQGIVHRDVKPANILLEKGVDRVMLTDFGLARAIDDASITRTGLIAGTPQYMSPEQARGEGLGARSDLFSLGSVLYTMTTGRPPFRAESTYGILRRITDSSPRPIREISSQSPAWLAAIIDKLLAKEPAKRFATSAEVALLLEQCLAHVQQPSVVALPKACRRENRWTCLLSRRSALAGALMMIILAALWWTQYPKPLPQPAPNAQPAAAESHSSPTDLGLQWDSVAGEIDELDRAATTLESQVDLLWDRDQVTTERDSTPESTTSPDQELKP
ncbi:MAG: prkC 7 [Planctomycetaceae bacterium]|nr:prkC 7 [Planctomycetaceae bacterium]